jgi:hypothetical protein
VFDNGEKMINMNGKHNNFGRNELGSNDRSDVNKFPKDERSRKSKNENLKINLDIPREIVQKLVNHFENI